MSFTVLTAEFSHETNTFSRRLTDMAAFAGRSCFLDGAKAIAARGNANTDLAGFLDAGRAHGWKIIHVLSAAAPPAGLVTRAAFDQLAGQIVQAAEDNKAALHGILLGLHGAMVTEISEDGEGELLARLRAVVGPDLPIAITLDPHANVTRRMCALANIIVSFKTYPHVDMRISGRHAGEVLERAMTGEIRPVTIRVARPMLEEVNGGRTDIGAMIGMLDRARAYEREPDVFAVSVNGGFASADIAEIGPTILVTGQGDLAKHRRFAESLADEIWAGRFNVLNQYLSVREAAAIGKNFKKQNGPLIIADYADNPGSGAYGDSTALLAALLEAGVSNACFGPMVDPESAQRLHRHKPGETVTLELGGKTDPRFGGGPLELTGILQRLSDGGYVGDGPMIGGLARSWGKTAVFRVAGIEILVVSRPDQMLDLQQFRSFGIDPAKKTVVALKSMQHFRAAFQPIAGKIIVCDSGALGTVNYAALPYRNVPRPIFPLDDDIDIEAWKRGALGGAHAQ